MDKFFPPSFRRSFRSDRSYCVEDNVDVEKIKFLQDIKYFKRLEDEFPKVKIDVSTDQIMIKENGSSKQFDEAVEKCRTMLSEIVKSSVPLSLGETNIWDVIACDEARDFIQNILIQEKVDAKVTPSEDGLKKVRIIALNSTARHRAKEVVVQSFVRETVEIPDDIDLSPHSGELQEIEQSCCQIQRGKPVKVQVIVEHSKKKFVELVGVASFVKDIKIYVKNLLEGKRVRIEYFAIDVSNSFWDFLYDHFRTKVKPIESQLDSYGVTINLTEKPKEFIIEGNMEGLRRCKKELGELEQTIVQRDEIIISQDVRNLFASGMEGENRLKTIENTRRIVVRKTPFVDVSLSENTTISRSQPCRSEVVNMLVKHGRIENEVADVLVNSALPNLKVKSPCLKVLQQRGGQAFIKECEQYTDIPTGDIVCTPGCEGLCKYVIHAVCQPWYNNEPEKSENFIRSLIKKVLKKCNELGALSVAMPIIGTGKYGYSKPLVVEIIRQEVVEMSTEEGSQFSLCDIRVIALEETNLQEAVNKGFVIDSPDKVILHFVGEKQYVDESIGKVKKFISKKKQERETPGQEPLMNIDLPSFWEDQPQGKIVHLVDLKESSSEYQEIFKHFLKNWNSKKTSINVSVKMIQRIQNPVLYTSYVARKRMLKKLKKGCENEMSLFHGTATKNIPIINVHNFSRSFTGATRGHFSQIYGQGVYFAKESSYSSGFCKDDDEVSANLSKKDLKMYVVKVLVGEFTRGHQKMKAPPLRNDPNNPGLQYESLVDNEENPTIFTIFQDNQCYPEYLITFIVQR
ncbi:uncharacterized protein LOC114528070 [Dendronephthya gigantea]|uniref:uncharacterized protein LOC114528070 n=1 Tax=Dendronephthya gigantea TaxID=151771 RepID=UPI00106A14A1|nr:uncharacterized protein LOC114528070 [Dendronephthya gigantea]